MGKHLNPGKPANTYDTCERCGKFTEFIYSYMEDESYPEDSNQNDLYECPECGYTQVIV